MLSQAEMLRKLSAVFEPRQAKVLTEVITEAYSDLVRARDFNELKEIVRELAEAQKRTELRVEELAEAQKRTEQRMEELARAQEALARAQEESQRQIQSLARAQEALARAQEESQRQIQELARQMGEMRRELGGLGRSMAYALENEAYRMLPAFLLQKYGIQVTERFIRMYVGDEEINLFGRGRQNGKEVLIMGEVKVRLEEGRREDPFEQLEKKARVVREAYPEEEILLLLVTHHAHPSVLRAAQEKGIIVIQSFEW